MPRHPETSELRSGTHHAPVLDAAHSTLSIRDHRPRRSRTHVSRPRPLQPAALPAFSAHAASAERRLPVLAVSKYTKGEIEKLFGIPGARIEVVYNAIDERFLRGHASDTDRQILAERYLVTYPFLL